VCGEEWFVLLDLYLSMFVVFCISLFALFIFIEMSVLLRFTLAREEVHLPVKNKCYHGFLLLWCNRTKTNNGLHNTTQKTKDKGKHIIKNPGGRRLDARERR
jgi:hypothetical protein